MLQRLEKDTIHKSEKREREIKATTKTGLATLLKRHINSPAPSTIFSTYRVVVAVVITATHDTLETPSIHLARKGTILSMSMNERCQRHVAIPAFVAQKSRNDLPKVERNDSLLKFLLLQNAPASSMRKPCDNVMVIRVGENHAVK